jgi:hypothetical protein
MAKTESNQVRERPQELSPSAAVSEQIQRALEMMQRVRTVNLDQTEKALKESRGNRYVLPEPLVLRVAESSSA